MRRSFNAEKKMKNIIILFIMKVNFDQKSRKNMMLKNVKAVMF